MLIGYLWNDFVYVHYGIKYEKSGFPCVSAHNSSICVEKTRKESPCTHRAYYRRRRLRSREQTLSVFRALIEFHTIIHLPVSNNADVWSLYSGAQVIYHVLCMHTVSQLQNVSVNNLTTGRGRRERNDEWFLIFLHLTFIMSYKSV